MNSFKKRNGMLEPPPFSRALQGKRGIEGDFKCPTAKDESFSLALFIPVRAGIFFAFGILLILISRRIASFLLINPLIVINLTGSLDRVYLAAMPLLCAPRRFLISMVMPV